MFCFSLQEIRNIFEAEKLNQIGKRVKNGELSVEDLFDRKKIDEIASEMSAGIGRRKEETEIFCAAYLLEEFHDGDPHICFMMKDSFDPNKNNIDSFEILKRNVKEDDLTDFLFFNGEDARAMQLKQYKEELNTNDFFKFIREKIRHYGNDLGQVNMLVLIQSPNGDIGNLDFDELNKRLIQEGLTFKGEILLSYNLKNESRVISRVYPSVAHKISAIEAINGRP